MTPNFPRKCCSRYWRLLPILIPRMKTDWRNADAPSFILRISPWVKVSARGDCGSIRNRSGASPATSIRSPSISMTKRRAHQFSADGGQRLAYGGAHDAPSGRKRVRACRRHHRRRHRRVARPRPVRPDDELRVESEVLEVRPSMSRPEQGMIKVRTTTLNGTAKRYRSSSAISWYRGKSPALPIG